MANSFKQVTGYRNTLKNYIHSAVINGKANFTSATVHRYQQHTVTGPAGQIVDTGK